MYKNTSQLIEGNLGVKFFLFLFQHSYMVCAYSPVKRLKKKLKMLDSGNEAAYLEKNSSFCFYWQEILIEYPFFMDQNKQ